MKRNSQRQRKVLEQYRCKPFTDGEWQNVRPEPGEDLNYVAENLSPRVAEYVLELAKLVETDRTADAVARDEAFLGFAGYWRRNIAGWLRPPFATLAEARDWVCQQSDDGKAAAIKAMEEGGATPPLPDPAFQWVYLPSAEPRGEEGNHVVQRIALDTARLVLPGEPQYLATTTQLVGLARAADAVALESRCWSLGQAAAFLLTGLPPKLPKWRLWTTSLPGGGRRSFFEIFGALNYRDMRAVHEALRRSAGVKGTKSFTAKDLELIQFVETTSRMTWAQRLETWNREYADRQHYAHPESLSKAHKQALKRMARP